jgi:hypothetical protein
MIYKEKLSNVHMNENIDIDHSNIENIKQQHATARRAFQYLLNDGMIHETNNCFRSIQEFDHFLRYELSNKYSGDCYDDMKCFLELLRNERKNAASKYNI